MGKYNTKAGNIRVPFTEDDEVFLKTVQVKPVKHSLWWHKGLLRYVKDKCKELYEAGEITDELSCLQAIERLAYEHLQKFPPRYGSPKIGLRSLGMVAVEVLKEIFNKEYELVVHIYRSRGCEDPFEKKASDTFSKTCLSEFYRVVLEIKPKEGA